VYHITLTLPEKITLILEEQTTKFCALENWFKTPQGTRVAHAFASELKEPSELFSGKRLVQLGSCGDNLWLPELRFRQKWVVSPSEDLKKSSLLASLTSLPIDRSSIDCVIAPLTLEAFSHNKNPLDEIDRILKPMGYVVFFGVNPWSFWGAALRWGGVHCFGDARGTLTSSLSLKHALLSRGYSQCMLSSFYYIPPVASKMLVHNLEFFNEMGKMIWPFPAGFYCFIAQKYQPASPSLLFNKYDDELLNLVRS